MIKLPPDITFVIQIVSFLVFWGLMRALLFAPVQKALAQRATHTSGAIARAAELRAEAERLTAEAEAKVARARAAAMDQVDEIRRTAEREEHATLDAFREQAAALLEKERAVTAKQVDDVRTPLRSEAEKLAGEVVVRVLGRAA